LEHLAEAAKNKKNRGLMKLKEDGLFNTDDPAEHACLRMMPEVAEKIIT
jgi:hypothetical protein